MLKKFISAGLMLAMVMTSVSAQATTLTPLVFEKTQNSSEKALISEDFEGVTEGVGYTTDQFILLPNNPAVTVTGKTESGNKYVSVVSRETQSKPMFSKNITATGNTIVLSFDYRNLKGSLCLYGKGEKGGVTVDNALTSDLTDSSISNSSLRYAQSMNNAAVDGKSEIIYTELASSTNTWRNFVAIYVTSQNVIHFFSDGEYVASSGFRKEFTSIKQLWIGSKSGSVDIDNFTMIDLGTTDDTWYHFDELEKLTFDYDSTNNASGTNISPLYVNNSNQADPNLSTAVIASDGTLKMTSSTATNLVSKHYQYDIKNKPSTGYAKMSFRYKLDVAPTDTKSRIDLFMNGVTIGPVMMYPDHVSSVYKNNSFDTAQFASVSSTDDGWHTMEVIFDFNNSRLQYVLDGTAYSTTIARQVMNFRDNCTTLNNCYFRYMSTDNTSAGYIDDVTFYEDGTYYMAPTLSSTKFDIDGRAYTITMSEKLAASYSPMSNIKNDITSDKAFTLDVIDTDGSGRFSDGDTVKLRITETDATYTYTVDVVSDIDTSMEALLVYGSDKQGDNYADTNFDGIISKAGKGVARYRITNNTSDTIVPFLAAAVYDDEGSCTSVDSISTVEIDPGKYTDLELNIDIPGNASNGTLKLFVWEDMSTMSPLAMTVRSYTIDTDDFELPTIMADYMVVQREADVTIFGKAPEGSTVTATLKGAGYTRTGTYTVPKGYNEFFAVLEDTGAASEEAKTLTITAVDAQGNQIGEEVLKGILIGDVFYGSGQSNMTRSFSLVKDDIAAGICSNYVPDESAGETYATLAEDYKNAYLEMTDELYNVRYFSTYAPTGYSRNSMDRSFMVANNEQWRIIAKATAAKTETTAPTVNIALTSEVMVRTAWSIQHHSDDHANVPIGIIVCAQGGTKLDKWVSKDTLLDHAAFAGTEERQDYIINKNYLGAADSRYAEPSDLYYDSARSVMPYTIKAAIWYQGEGDSSNVYDKFLAAMADEYQTGFHNEKLPWIVVELAGYQSGSSVSDGVFTSSGTALRRLLQWNAQNLTNDIYTVVTGDSGDNTNIHPANKDVVGDRCARMILNQVDGVDISYMGPVFKSVAYSGNTATISVDVKSGGTLKMYDETVGKNLFALYDGTSWYRADSIDVNANNNTITVSCSTMTTNATGVSYAYGPEIIKCIYAEFNDGGMLPMAPFNTEIKPNQW